MHQLIEECCEEVPEEQKQNMEKTMLDLVKICHHKQFLCMHDDEQEVKIIEEQPTECRNLAPILSTKEPENSLSMGYEHLSITPETESDEVTDDDESFKDIEYDDASVPDPPIVSVEEENVVQREDEDVDLEDISQVQDVVLREKLFSITRLISNIKSLNDNSTPDCVFNSFESDNSLLDNYSPEFETFCDHSEETRSEEADLFLFDNSIPPGIENFADDPDGDIRFLEELLINDSILSHESFDSNFEDSPSNSRPPLEPPDDNFDLEPEVISAVMEDNDELDEHFNPGGEIFVSTNNEDVDYFPFMFVIRIFLTYLILLEISPLLLSVESEDTIFDPGLSPEIEVILCRIYVRFPRSSYLLIDFSLGRDGENIDKMKEKSDACIFVGYSTQSRAYRFKSQSSKLRNVPIAVGTVTTSNELDLLFSLMVDELLNGSTQVVSKSSAVNTADAPNKCLQHTTSLNTQTTPEPTCQVPTQAPTVTSTENINQAKTITENAQVEDDKFINIFCTPVQERGKTSSRRVDSSNMHTFYQRHPFEHRRKKDHLIEQVIGNPSQSVRTKRQPESDGELCTLALIVSRTEQNNIKEAMADSTWIKSMQEELHQFDRLDVWELVDRPLCKNVINMK
nr:hypothetical protein [Tanacetum cinerariifolium]